MKRALGIARCGLACCLCSENARCTGCHSEDCPDKAWCENRICSMARGLRGCFDCDAHCEKGMFRKIKPFAFRKFIQVYGMDALLDCLERNEKNGVVYHREGVNGDYDAFDTVDALLEFIKTGRRSIP